MDNWLYTEKFSDEPITGKVYRNFGEKDNLKKVYMGNLLNGGRKGRWIIWYDNGQKKSEGTYKDGRPNGLYTEWNESGQKLIQITYKDGKVNGLFTQWNEGGWKEGESTWKDNKLISSKEWNKDGSEKKK